MTIFRWRTVPFQTINQHAHLARAIASGLCALLVSGCVAPEPGDLVSTEADAIRIVTTKCDLKRPLLPSERWHAVLQQGVWHVWLSVGYERAQQDDVLDTHVRANDGFADDCALAD
jgi:hypothetical protein